MDPSPTQLKKKKKKSDLVIWIDSGLGLSGSSLVLHVLLKKKKGLLLQSFTKKSIDNKIINLE